MQISQIYTDHEEVDFSDLCGLKNLNNNFIYYEIYINQMLITYLTRAVYVTLENNI